MEEVDFTENKEYLEKELKAIYNQKDKFLLVDEVEERLEKIIRKPENNL